MQIVDNFMQILPIYCIFIQFNVKIEQILHKTMYIQKVINTAYYYYYKKYL
nr:MAG TPA: hypothetical protein [Microviridae sp.]